MSKVTMFQSTVLNAFVSAETGYVHFASEAAADVAINAVCLANGATVQDRDAYWSNDFPRVRWIRLYGGHVATVKIFRSSYDRTNRYFYVMVEVVLPQEAAAARRLQRHNARNNNERYMKARARVMNVLSSGGTVQYRQGQEYGTFNVPGDLTLVAALRTLIALGVPEGEARSRLEAEQGCEFQLYEPRQWGRPGSLEWEMTAG